MWRAVIVGWSLVAMSCAQEVACEAAPEPGETIIDPGAGLDGVDRTAPSSCLGPWVVGVRGRVEDPAGAGLAGVRTQLCVVPYGTESLRCLAPPTTDEGGDFTAVVTDLEAKCAGRITMRALLPGTAYATTYCELPLEPEDAVIELSDAIRLFPTEAPECLPAIDDPAAPRTVQLGGGVELVELRPEQLSDYDRLSAARHDLTGHCMLNRAPEGGFLATYGFRPEADVDGGVAVRLPNDEGLAPGTRVELFVIGGLNTTLLDGTTVEESEWASFGIGTVSDDGAVIESDPGVRLTALTWLGYRAVP